MKRLPVSNRAHSGENVAQLRTTLLRALQLPGVQHLQGPRASSSPPHPETSSTWEPSPVLLERFVTTPAKKRKAGF